ncbi:hypothetical protein Lfu02_29140 [Longispora fulva]|uniref:Multidrug efflux pump subunit AcrB n=1 Tax=Longispora fulva TaxID=619741 RepID=A0A8J7GV35_9ACTN|nr:hypothetical protein [Longispora fulva]MBG6139049.1 multidrug efflux pump subunit AcrB [Longispora fulva]GIG58542.1 hypothetical protein Lfu02_29140 [Longispora fulva]
MSSPLRRGQRWPIYPVRVLCLLLAALVLTQAALAGGFISGHVALLGIHSANAILIALIATVLVPCTALLVRPGRGPWWPVPASAGLWILIVTQIGLGYGRVLQGHVPLGMSIFGVLAVLTVWSFRYRPKWTGA